MFPYWSFISLQHLKPYHDRYQFVTGGHPWGLTSAAPLADQATCTVTQFPTQSHYPRYCSVLVMLSTRVGSDKYQFCTPLIKLYWEYNFQLSTFYQLCHHVSRLETRFRDHPPDLARRDKMLRAWTRCREYRRHLERNVDISRGTFIPRVERRHLAKYG